MKERLQGKEEEEEEGEISEAAEHAALATAAHDAAVAAAVVAAVDAAFAAAAAAATTANEEDACASNTAKPCDTLYVTPLLPSVRPNQLWRLFGDFDPDEIAREDDSACVVFPTIEAATRALLATNGWKDASLSGDESLKVSFFDVHALVEDDEEEDEEEELPVGGGDDDVATLAPSLCNNNDIINEEVHHPTPDHPTPPSIEPPVEGDKDDQPIKSFATTEQVLVQVASTRTLTPSLCNNNNIKNEEVHHPTPEHPNPPSIEPPLECDNNDQPIESFATTEQVLMQVASARTQTTATEHAPITAGATTNNYDMGKEPSTIMKPSSKRPHYGTSYSSQEEGEEVRPDSYESRRQRGRRRRGNKRKNEHGREETYEEENWEQNRNRSTMHYHRDEGEDHEHYRDSSKDRHQRSHSPESLGRKQPHSASDDYYDNRRRHHHGDPYENRPDDYDDRRDKQGYSSPRAHSREKDDRPYYYDSPSYHSYRSSEYAKSDRHRDRSSDDRKRRRERENYCRDESPSPPPSPTRSVSRHWSNDDYFYKEQKYAEAAGRGGDDCRRRERQRSESPPFQRKKNTYACSPRHRGDFDAARQEQEEPVIKQEEPVIKQESEMWTRQDWWKHGGWRFTEYRKHMAEKNRHPDIKHEESPPRDL